VFIQEYRRPGRQATDYSDIAAAHGSKVKEPGFSHPPRLFDTPLLRSITNGALIDPLPVRRSSIAKLGARNQYIPSQAWEPRTFSLPIHFSGPPFGAGVPSMPRYTPRMRREDHVGRKRKSIGRPAPDGIVSPVTFILST
jgi:hypothetical protein